MELIPLFAAAVVFGSGHSAPITPPTIDCDEVTGQVPTQKIFDNCLSIQCANNYRLDLAGIDANHHFIKSVTTINCALELSGSENSVDYVFSSLATWNFNGTSTIDGSIERVSFPQLQLLQGDELLLGPSGTLASVSFNEKATLGLNKIRLCNVPKFEKNLLGSLANIPTVEECPGEDPADEKEGKSSTNWWLRPLIIVVAVLSPLLLIILAVIFRAYLLVAVYIIIGKIRNLLSWLDGTEGRLAEIITRVRRRILMWGIDPHSVCTDTLVEGEVLGQGAFGRVVRVSSPRFEDCAAKIFKEIVGRPELEIRQAREIEIGLLLRGNKNVVKTHAALYDTDPRQPVGILLEVLNGNMAEYIINYTQNNIKKLNKFSWDIANGLYYLHQNSILHRDLRPDNILLCGTRSRCKLADFGLAKRFVRGQNNTIPIGNLLFSAPEQWLTPRYNRKADVYAYATTLYYIYYKTAPYKKADFKAGFFEEATANAMNIRNPPRPALGGQVIDSLLVQCWERRMHDRPSMQAVVEILSDREKYPRRED